MPRAEMPMPTWDKLKTDPLGWRLRYINDGVVLGEPAWFKGEEPSDEENANHLMFDDTRVSSILVRSQGQNPIEIRIEVPGPNPGDPPQGEWMPLSEAPYFGPAEQPVFPEDSVWAHWNDMGDAKPA